MNKCDSIVVKARDIQNLKNSKSVEDECFLLGAVGARLFRDLKDNGVAKITMIEFRCMAETHENIYTLFSNFIFEMESSKQELIKYFINQSLSK